MTISEAVAYLECEYDAPLWEALGRVQSTNYTRPLYQVIPELHANQEDCDNRHCPHVKFRQDCREGREMDHDDTREWAMRSRDSHAHELYGW